MRAGLALFAMFLSDPFIKGPLPRQGLQRTAGEILRLKDMIAYKWNGVGDYDALLMLSEEEMKALADHYQISWSFFTEGPKKSFDGKYFCFVSFSRKALALLPFLSLAFGGQYDELPMDSEEQNLRLCYEDYSLEKFSF